jgi:hypothetical protein
MDKIVDVAFIKIKLSVHNDSTNQKFGKTLDRARIYAVDFKKWLFFTMKSVDIVLLNNLVFEDHLMNFHAVLFEVLFSK